MNLVSSPLIDIGFMRPPFFIYLKKSYDIRFEALLISFDFLGYLADSRPWQNFLLEAPFNLSFLVMRPSVCKKKKGLCCWFWGPLIHFNEQKSKRRGPCCSFWGPSNHYMRPLWLKHTPILSFGGPLSNMFS